jgi:uncharacterized protein (DUF1015 family)
MAHVQPFRGLRPVASAAAAVSSVPYDVIARADAKRLCAQNKDVFLHVTRPEAALADDVDAASSTAHQAGAQALARLRAQKTLVQDQAPAFYVYSLTQFGHTQTGIVVQASVADYEAGMIKRHEYTRPDKETERVLHMQAVSAQTGKVWLVHKDAPSLAHLAAVAQKRAASVDFVASDGVRHQLWVVDHADEIALVVQGFAAVGPLYIADGHHRAAAAARVAALRIQEANKGPSALATTDAAGHRPAWASILAVAFPASQMRILAYNRVVSDLGALSKTQFLDALTEEFGMTQGKPEPILPHQFGMYFDGVWRTLHLRPGRPLPTDAVGRLDVSLLQTLVLGPLLGIEDPRRDKRIDFIGGVNADAQLQARVEAGWAVAFKLCAPNIDDMLRIADAQEVMPPKSTWFEPKLRDGLVVSLF